MTCDTGYKLNNWGCTHPLFGKNQLLTVITYPNRSALLIAKYLRSNAGCDYKYYAYQLEGTDVDSPELVFNRLLHPLSVSVGQKFQIWYGEDLTECEGNDNMGMTCAIRHLHYTSPKIYLVASPQKFRITFVFNFSRV